jgi:hypothetical protein
MSGAARAKIRQFAARASRRNTSRAILFHAHRVRRARYACVSVSSIIAKVRAPRSTLGLQLLEIEQNGILCY